MTKRPHSQKESSDCANDEVGAAIEEWYFLWVEG